MTASSYDVLATDYHWLFTDEHVSGQTFREQYGRALARLRPGGKVLDCACGAGFEVISLAQAGFSVSATDASEGMVAEARRRLERAGLDVRVGRCSWEELPGRFEAEFDGVFCVGNSLAHSPSPEAMVASLRAMFSVLRPGGVLVLESRDWERLRSAGQRLEVRERVAVRDGVRGFTVLFWTIPEHIEETHLAELVVFLEHDLVVSHRLVELRFIAYTVDDLKAQLRGAGFGELDTYDGYPGRYVMTARRSPAAGRTAR
jgi:SAM-dependent methyltransferase